MDKTPIILDTDIGSDIDDAVALAYLLRQPRCELVGITTVTGEASRRASLADAICRAAGRSDVPIHVGIEPPLRVEPRQPKAPQAEALTGSSWPHRTFDTRPTAIDFLRETIRSRPHEVTLLTIGPLTNIAHLFAVDPEIPMLLQRHVLMGGRYFEGEPNSNARMAQVEWNMLCDPHAATAVFAAPVPSTLAVGLDVTMQCRLSADECRRRFAAAGGPLAPVAAMAEIWFRDRPEITFHDPLAASLIFESSLCEMQACTIEVLLDPDRAGTAIPRLSDDPRHAIARTVDVARFFEHYFATVSDDRAPDSAVRPRE